MGLCYEYLSLHCLYHVFPSCAVSRPTCCNHQNMNLVTSEFSQDYFSFQYSQAYYASSKINYGKWTRLESKLWRCICSLSITDWFCIRLDCPWHILLDRIFPQTHLKFSFCQCFWIPEYFTVQCKRRPFAYISCRCFCDIAYLMDMVTDIGYKMLVGYAIMCYN